MKGTDPMNDPWIAVPVASACTSLILLGIAGLVFHIRNTIRHARRARTAPGWSHEEREAARQWNELTREATARASLTFHTPDPIPSRLTPSERTLAQTAARYLASGGWKVEDDTQSDCPDERSEK